MVRHIEQAPPMGGQPRYLMFNHLLPPFDAVSSPLTDLDGGPLTSPLPCAPGGSCVRTVDGNDYGTLFLAAVVNPTPIASPDVSAICVPWIVSGCGGRSTAASGLPLARLHL